jgi:hypothetical protein
MNIGNIKSQLSVIKEVIWQLDQAQDRRSLSQSKLAFKARLKDLYIGLLSLEKVRARQRSRLTNIKHGDANTKLCYLIANGRRRRKHIQILRTAQGLAIKQEDKEKEVAHHFEELLGTKHSRSISINWEELNYPSFNLANQEASITSEEVKRAISDMPKENVSGPDGFIGAFYAACWETVRSDVT